MNFFQPQTSLCSGPLRRRSFLQAGVVGLTAAGLARCAKGAAETKAPETSVIYLWLSGGPPHLDTYDMKPEAPSEIRGEFRPIKTNVAGIHICELFPQQAKIADKFSLIRSISHKFADHGGGHKRFMTGRDPKEPTGFVNDYPAVGSMIAKMREHISVGLPNYIAGVDGGRTGIDTFSLGTAYMGPSYSPFTLGGDPAAANFQVQNISLDEAMESRLSDRQNLLKGFDRLRNEVDRSGSMNALDRFQQKASELLLSDKARSAFDLTREDQATRDRYGMHGWGQRCLMARRLVEAGSSFVMMSMENPYISGVKSLKNGTYNWDSHAVNCHIFEDARVRFPLLDQAVSALIEDVFARGLDKKVMIVLTGEFGRSPRVEQSVGTQTGVMQPGRDHWPSAQSVLVSGGGLKMGQVVGSTNNKGEHPVDRPLSPNDLWSTMLRHLRIDQNVSFLDHNGRPMPLLSDGAPIAELI